MQPLKYQLSLKDKEQKITSNYFTFENNPSVNELRKYGNIVTFYINAIANSNITAWNMDAFTFPEGYRVSSYTLLTVALGNQSTSDLQNKTIAIALSLNGGLQLGINLAKGQRIQFSGVFICS